MAYLIGQILGALVSVLTIVIPFFKKKWQILTANMASNLLLMLNLILIGQFGSGAYLCMVAILQIAVSLIHNRKGTEVSLAETILFTVLYVGFGFFGIVSAPDFVWAINGRNLVELLPVVGALMLMISVFTPDEQTTRKFLLANTAIWTVYTAIVGSTVFFADLIATISAAAALYRYRKKS